MRSLKLNLVVALAACAAWASATQQAAAQTAPATAISRPGVTLVQNGTVPHRSPGPGWVLAGLNDRGSFWVHLPTRQRTGDIVQVWLIQNYPQRNQLGALSMRLQLEYRCTQRLWRVLNNYEHANVNAGGVMIGFMDNSASQWDAIPPDTKGERVMNAACQR